MHEAVLRKANQIATNFRHHPADQAAGEVANHIRSFWPPQMREELFELADQPSSGLDPIALAAVARLRAS